MNEGAKLKKKVSQESLFKIFCFNNSGTRKIKNLQKHYNKRNSCTLHSENIKHTPFQFIPWPNFIGFQNLSPGIGGKVLTD